MGTIFRQVWKNDRRSLLAFVTVEITITMADEDPQRPEWLSETRAPEPAPDAPGPQQQPAPEPALAQFLHSMERQQQQFMQVIDNQNQRSFHQNRLSLQAMDNSNRRLNNALRRQHARPEHVSGFKRSLNDDEYAEQQPPSSKKARGATEQVLRDVIKKLHAENQKLKSENQQLASENQQLASENQQLMSENQQLKSDKQQLASEIDALKQEMR